MLKSFMFAPVNMFFDVTPSGVILNRFSKDFRVVEILLPENFEAQINSIMNIIIQMYLIANNFIWILAIVPLVAISLIF